MTKFKNNITHFFTTSFVCFSLVLLVAATPVLVFAAPPQENNRQDELSQIPLIASIRFFYEPLLGEFNTQKFLEDRGSKLATVRVAASNKTEPILASQAINETARKYDLAPQILLVLLELHTGLIDSKNPNDDQLKKPFNLPTQAASGFYAQLEWVAKFLAETAPKYNAVPNTDKSPDTALRKLLVHTKGTEQKNNLNDRSFEETYKKFFSVESVSFPAELNIDLSGAKLPFTGTKRYTSGPHGNGTTAGCVQVALTNASAIDFARNTTSDPESFEVLSILPGTLIARDANASGGIGNRIRIKHSDTLTSEYWHLASFSSEIQSLEPGKPVPQGFKLGLAGDTGGQDGIHLHLELRTPSNVPVSWDGKIIDSYNIGMHRINSNPTFGYNYQGSGVIGNSKLHQITAFCGDTSANLAVVGNAYNGTSEQNGLDPNTIFADITAGTSAGRMMSSNGAPKTWIKNFGASSTSQERAYSATLLADGSYIVAGHTGADATLIKLDSSGNVLWQKKYSPGNSMEIKSTSDGGFVSVGNYLATSSSPFDIIVKKFDTNGNVLWQKTYGGSHTENAQSIEQTSDGGYIIGGHTRSVNGGSGGGDAWVIKINATGDISWQKSYGDSYSADYANSVIQLSDGSYIFTGRNDSTNFGSNMWVVKLDTSGNIVWKKTYKSVSTKTSIGHRILQLSDGDFIVLGFSNGATLYRLNSAGDILWQRVFKEGDASGAISFVIDQDNGFILGGNTYTSGLGEDVWIIKVNSQGNIVWQNKYGGSKNDGLTKIIKTSDAGILAVGSTESYGTAVDMWLLKLDGNGTTGNSCLIIKPSSATETTQTSNLVSASIVTRSVTTTTVSPNITTSTLALTSSQQCTQ